LSVLKHFLYCEFLADCTNGRAYAITSFVIIVCPLHYVLSLNGAS